MAGEYIEFNNNTEPAINDINLNRLQQMIKQDIQGAVSGDTLPIGAIIPFGSDTVPTNWLLCDGSAVSRETYQDLFNVIGISYGQGDGFTTFNLPDLRGRVGVGKSSDTEFNTLGKTGGEKTHTLTIDEIPSHQHNIQGLNSSGTSVAWTDRGVEYGDNNVGFNVGIRTNYVGGNQSHNILQPYTVANYIIKAYQSSGVVANVAQSETQSDTDTYSCNYINKIHEVNAITVGLNNEFSIAGGGNYKRVNGLATVHKIGNKLSLNNAGNAVVIGAGVSKVKVSAKLGWYTNEGSIKYAWLHRTGYGIAWSTINVPSGAYASDVIPEIFVDVQEGQEIYLEIYSETPASLTDGNRTFFTVEVVE